MLMSCILLFASQAAECGLEDHECNAKQYERLAAAAKAPQYRADQLYGAHRAYTARFDETGKAEHLCAARRTFNQGIAVKGQTDGQKAAFAALRAALAARERKSGVECRKTGKRMRNPVAEPAAPLRIEPSAPARTGTESVAGLENVTPARAPLATRPAKPKQVQTPPIHQPTRAYSGAASEKRMSPRDPVARRRFRAGVGTLVPGVVFLGPVAGLLMYRGAVRADWDALQTASKGRFPTHNEENAATALNRQFRGTTAAVAVLGAASAALVITGTILLATGRRSTRVAVGPWGARDLSGFVVQGSF